MNKLPKHNHSFQPSRYNKLRLLLRMKSKDGPLMPENPKLQLIRFPQIQISIITRSNQTFLNLTQIKESDKEVLHIIVCILIPRHILTREEALHILLASEKREPESASIRLIRCGDSLPNIRGFLRDEEHTIVVLEAIACKLPKLDVLYPHCDELPNGIVLELDVSYPIGERVCENFCEEDTIVIEPINHGQDLEVFSRQT